MKKYEPLLEFSKKSIKHVIMRPDLKFLYDNFDRINRVCYRGLLPRPEIKLNNRLRSLGLTCARINRLTRKKTIWIEISVKMDLPESDYINTLAHEMIHYYIMVNGLKDSSQHGRIFRSEMDRLKRDHGLSVTISYKPVGDETLRVAPAVRYFCITKKTQEDFLITVVAKTRIFRLWDEMNSIRNLEKIGWFVSTDPELQRFPRATTGIKFYKISKESVDRLLQSACALKRYGNTIQPIL